MTLYRTKSELLNALEDEFRRTGEYRSYIIVVHPDVPRGEPRWQGVYRDHIRTMSSDKESYEDDLAGVSTEL